MSYGMFDDLTASRSESQIREAAASEDLHRAIVAVRDEFGDFLGQALDRGDYRARCALVKNDLMKVVSHHLMPLPGVVRRVEAALRPDFERRANTGLSPEAPVSPAEDFDPLGGEVGGDLPLDDMGMALASRGQGPARTAADEDFVDYDETLPGDAFSDEDLGETPDPKVARRRIASGGSGRVWVCLPSDDPDRAIEILQEAASKLSDKSREASRRVAIDTENTDIWLPHAHDQLTTPGGGFTFKEEPTDGPADGWMVAMDKGTESPIAMDAITRDDIIRYVTANKDAIEAPDNYFGGWVAANEDGPGHTSYLDVSTRFGAIEEALEAAQQADQRAIWDNELFTDIYTHVLPNLLDYVGQHGNTADVRGRWYNDVLKKAIDRGEDWTIEPKREAARRHASPDGKPLIPDADNQYLDNPNSTAVDEVFDGPVSDDSGTERHTQTASYDDVPTDDVTLARIKAARRPFVQRP